MQKREQMTSAMNSGKRLSIKLVRFDKNLTKDCHIQLDAHIHIKNTYEQPHEISNNVVCGTSKASDQPAHTRSLIRVFASRLNIL